MQKWSPVLVTWGDAHGGDTGWMEPEDIKHEPEPVETIGLLWKHDNVGISLIMSKTSDDEVGGYMFIPAGMVMSIKPLQKEDGKNATLTDNRPLT